MRIYRTCVALAFLPTCKYLKLSNWKLNCRFLFKSPAWWIKYHKCDAFDPEVGSHFQTWEHSYTSSVSAFFLYVNCFYTTQHFYALKKDFFFIISKDSCMKRLFADLHKIGSDTRMRRLVRTEFLQVNRQKYRFDLKQQRYFLILDKWNKNSEITDIWTVLGGLLCIFFELWRRGRT